jgi:FixJ family two-component response regulator
LIPSSINFIDNPIADDQMLKMINSAISVVEEEDKKIKQQEEIEEYKEKQKYQER